MRYFSVTSLSASPPPAETNPATGATGSSSSAARADHLHAVAAPATPSSQQFIISGASGAGTGFATDTHQHGGANSMILAASQYAEWSTSNVAATDLVTASGLSIPASHWVTVRLNARITDTAGAIGRIGLKINGTVMMDPTATGFWQNVGLGADRNGWGEITFGPVGANYDPGSFVRYAASTTGGHNVANSSNGFLGLTNGRPNATITSITITASAGNAANTIYAANYEIWSNP